MVLLHLPLEDAPHVLNRVQVWRHTWPLHHLHLQQQGSCHLGGVFGVAMLENSFWMGHPLLLQNVAVHVGIHVSLNEPQLQSTSSSHAAPDHDATTTMLDCRQGTIFLVLLTRASPHLLDTLWVKQVYLRLIRPQDMVPVIYALGQVFFSKLFAGFYVSQLQKRLPSGTTVMQTDLLQCVVYGLSTDKLTFQFCNLLSNAGSTHASVFFKPASAPDAQHKDSTSLIDPCEACSEWNPSWKTSVWPWPLYCNSVPGCYRTSYSPGHLCGEQQF